MYAKATVTLILLVLFESSHKSTPARIDCS